MPPAIVKLVAVLLLVVQGVMASGPGRVLCIPLGDCGSHDTAVADSCRHCDVHMGRDSGCLESSGHERGPYSVAFHPPDECGCHLHVPLPDNKQVPSKGDSPDLRAFVVPLLVAVVMAWDFEPPLAAPARVPPPDFSVSDQVLGLKTTRLLI